MGPTTRQLKAYLKRAAGGLTPYQILGVHRQSSPEDLTKARRALALCYHPDRHKDEPEIAHQAMAMVNQAYDILSDKRRTDRYLAELASTHKPCEACGGTGVKRKQKGFKVAELTACAGCEGLGLQKK